jgi:hypothetical protein
MTPFSFEHTFRTASSAAVFAAYFDPEHQVEQDRAVDVARREVLALDDGPECLRRTSRVVPQRQLPAYVRVLVPGELHYVETLCWRKLDDAIDLEIRPSLLKGRASITALYRVSQVSDGQFSRTYAGTVSVDVPLVGARIERGIIAEFERSLAVAAACTQTWLDRHPLLHNAPLNPGNPSGILGS